MDRKKLSDVLYNQPVRRISLTRAKELLDCVLDEIIEGLVREGEVKLHRFGRFVVYEKGERVGRNPKTGEAAVIAPRKSVSFHPSPEFKVAVNEGAEWPRGRPSRGNELTRDLN